jgi:hypothetical protein
MTNPTHAKDVTDSRVSSGHGHHADTADAMLTMAAVESAQTARPITCRTRPDAAMTPAIVAALTAGRTPTSGTMSAPVLSSVHCRPLSATRARAMIANVIRLAGNRVLGRNERGVIKSRSSAQPE